MVADDVSPSAGEFPLPEWDNDDLIREEPELHHYTTRGGLEGIVKSQTLWGTHFEDLNDASELIHLRTPLEQELTAAFTEMLRVRRRERLTIDRAVRSVGGLRAAAVSLASDMCRHLYASTFVKDEVFEGVKDTQGPAFITSFCSHRTEAYERENGLLSQWRGYGQGGGYCIVFDTPGLFELMSQECSRRAYLHMSINPVIYADPDKPLATLFPDLMSGCEGIIEFLLDRRQGDPTDFFTPFIRAATHYKHQGFHEEREIRIAAKLASPGFRQTALELNGRALPPDKATFGGEGSPRRIALFEDLDAPLPIKRVIVGPSADQEEKRQWAQSVVGNGIEVCVSETPYIERKG